ncbi:MAG: lipoprotein insertase outer membrane protein LolB [Reinekea sp.]
MIFSISKVILRQSLLLLVLLQLTGCALFQKNSLPDTGDWAFKGKMAIRNEKEASSFNVTWVQQGLFYRIILSGPLRQGEMTIEGQPGNVVLTSGKDTYHANSLNQLVYELTELELPLDHISYWVRGLAMPGEKASISTSESGQINLIEQAGWLVSYNDYFTDQSALPRKLSFVREQSSGKLFIREWNIQTN